jgi:GntR family transcriptional regulator/MocR family aminotransferase
VSRNTVVAAFDELVAQGWVSSQGAAGTFVAAELPDRHVLGARAAGLARRPTYELAQRDPTLSPIAAEGARVLLSAGVPDPRLFPRIAMARAYRRALRSRAATSALDYGSPLGTDGLRAAIATMLRATRAIPVGPEHVMITRGSQMALDLAARALIRPGDVAAVEYLGYQPAWRALEYAGARLAGVDVDAHGLVVDALPGRIRCVYTTPHHQYPTTVLMSPGRRLALLERARRERFAIIEDDYDHEFHFDGRPVAPLASTDGAGSVIYVGSLSKILAPGVRIGFVAAPEPVVSALAAMRGAVDRQGDHVLELAIADLVEDGEIQRHAHKLRRVYAARRDAFVELLRKQLGGVLETTLPAGGITLWARVADDVPLERWRTRALEMGVAFATARDLALDRKPRPFIRLAFARYNEAELAAATRVLVRALR